MSGENSSTGTFLGLLEDSFPESYLRDKLRANVLLKQYFLEVDLQHVGLFNEELAHAIQEQPGEIMLLASLRPTMISFW